MTLYINKVTSQALVAHACNPSYPGGRDQKDHGSKPAWGNSLRDLISKIHKRKRKRNGSSCKSPYLASMRP
jgi:hypothetical protein